MVAELNLYGSPGCPFHCCGDFRCASDAARFHYLSLPLASALSGGAAVLMAVHKALKCDEYQAECLRLSQAYQSIAVSADSALSGTEEKQYSQQERLTNKLEILAESAKAQVATSYVSQAEKNNWKKIVRSIHHSTHRLVALAKRSK